MEDNNVRNLAFPENNETPVEQDGPSCNFILLNSGQDKPCLPGGAQASRPAFARH